MMYKEISILLNKIGIDLEKIKIDLNISRDKDIKKDLKDTETVNFNDISLEEDNNTEEKYNEEDYIYDNEETLENIYLKLKSIYGDKKYNIKQEAILENNIKKVYRYIPISKIEVMVTNHSRNDKIKDKLKDAIPIIDYIYSKEFKDFDRVRLEYLLKDYNNSKYQEIDNLQKRLLEKEPFKITYEILNFIYEIGELVGKISVYLLYVQKIQYLKKYNTYYKKKLNIILQEKKNIYIQELLIQNIQKTSYTKKKYKNQKIYYGILQNHGQLHMNYTIIRMNIVQRLQEILKYIMDLHQYIGYL